MAEGAAAGPLRRRIMSQKHAGAPRRRPCGGERPGGAASLAATAEVWRPPPHLRLTRAFSLRARPFPRGYPGNAEACSELGTPPLHNERWERKKPSRRVLAERLARKGTRAPRARGHPVHDKKRRRKRKKKHSRCMRHTTRTTHARSPPAGATATSNFPHPPPPTPPPTSLTLSCTTRHPTTSTSNSPRRPPGSAQRGPAHWSTNKEKTATETLGSPTGRLHRARSVNARRS